MSLSRAPLSAKLGLVIVVFYLLVATLGPVFSPYSQSDIVGSVWEPISKKFWLGTDNVGRDMLSRMIYGTRTTLFIAFIATSLSFTWGILTGFFAAVSGGWIDQIMSRWVDLLMAFPTLIFALVVLSIVPINMTTLILVMATLDSTRVFRIARALAADTAVMDYVEVAKLRGENTAWIIFREILPNTLTPLIAEYGLRFSFAVLFLSSLSFLGLGVQPPMADWGGMVRDNSQGIIFGFTAPLIPAAALAILTVSVNFVVDWILDKTSDIRNV
jgi:peptide/nickel transport system permease protein